MTRNCGEGGWFDSTHPHQTGVYLGSRKRKYSKRFEEDWNFYLKNKDKFTFCGQDVSSPEYDEKGLDPKECFFTLDSQGKLCPCNDPKTVREILICKKSINFHIKMWTEGYNDCFIGFNDYIAEFEDPPDWIEKSFRGQLIKKYRASWRNWYPHNT